MYRFLTGQAGTGKTYKIKEEIRQDKKSFCLCATTGIAAVNLADRNGSSDVTTINSLLKYFDTKSLEDNFASGRLFKRMKEIARAYRGIAIDECSMLSAAQLDYIVMAVEHVNELKEFDNKQFNLTLIGDFCQLSPVNEKYAFEAETWNRFTGENGHIEKLTKIWRQDNIEFVNALNCARQGDGDGCADILVKLGVDFVSVQDTNFDGTTLFAKRADMERFNEVQYRRLVEGGKKVFTFPSYRWGVQRSEWKNIPSERKFTKDSYVMILSNNPPTFEYVNGDCGYVVEADLSSKKVIIKLKRTGRDIILKPIVRKCFEKEIDGKEIPEFLGRKEYEDKMTEGDTAGVGYEDTVVEDGYKSYLQSLTTESRRNRVSLTEPYFDFVEMKWVVGEINYIPLDLAYATTVHKSQGLTLDNVQIDPTANFFGQGSMMYVALSRCRTPEGLRIVGSPKLLASRCNVFEEILDWI